MSLDPMPTSSPVAPLPERLLRVDRVDHIAVAVDDLPAAVRLYADVLGGRFVMGGDHEGKGIRTVQIHLPDVKFELITPLHQESYLFRYLQRHGPGFHHLTMFVEDVAAAVAEVDAAGFELVDIDLHHPAWREAYVRPRSGFGTLLQLVQTNLRWDVGKPDMTIDDVLAGRIVWVNHQVWWRHQAPEPDPLTLGPDGTGPARSGLG